MSMRDGVMIYQCADPAQCPGGTVQGFANTPRRTSRVTTARRRRSSPASTRSASVPACWRRSISSSFPPPNDAGLDGYNIMAHKFTAPFSNTFNTTIGRVDYRPAGNQSFFGRFNVQRDTELDVPQYPDRDLPPNTTRRDQELGHGDRLGLGIEREARQHVPIRVHEDAARQDRHADRAPGVLPVRRRPERGVLEQRPANAHAQLRQRHDVAEGQPHGQVRHQPAIHSHPQLHRCQLLQLRQREPLVGQRRRTHVHSRPRQLRPARLCGAPAVADGWNWADAWITMLGVVSAGTGQYNYDREGNLLPAGEAARRNYAMDEYEFYAQDSWRLGDKLTVNGGLRYSLASPPWETNGLQVSPNVSLGERFKEREEMMAQGDPGEHAARHPVRARRPGERTEGLLRLGQEQLRAPGLGGLDADQQAGRAWRLLAGLRPHRSRPRAELRRATVRSACPPPSRVRLAAPTRTTRR